MAKSIDTITLPRFTDDRAKDLRTLLLTKHLIKKDLSQISYGFTKYSDHLNAIQSAINNRDHNLLGSLLSFDMEDDVNLTFVEKTYADLNTGVRSTTPAEYWIDKRPFLEWVFINKPDDFSAIIDALNKSDENCYQVFISKLEKTDLSASIQHLLTYDENTSLALTNSIKELEEYGGKLKKDGVDKGKTILTVTGTLTELLQLHNQFILDSRDVCPWQKNLMNLKFRMLFRKAAHSEDNILNEYRGCGRFLVNLMTILFTACIANFINLAVTNKFLFFNEVTTKNLVDKMDNVLEFSPNPF